MASGAGGAHCTCCRCCWCQCPVAPAASGFRSSADSKFKFKLPVPVRRARKSSRGQAPAPAALALRQPPLPGARGLTPPPPPRPAPPRRPGPSESEPAEVTDGPGAPQAGCGPAGSILDFEAPGLSQWRWPPFGRAAWAAGTEGSSEGPQVFRCSSSKLRSVLWARASLVTRWIVIEERLIQTQSETKPQWGCPYG